MFIYRYSLLLRSVPSVYRRVIEKNYITDCNSTNLNDWKAIAKEPLPSFISIGTQLISYLLQVNGAAMDASVSEIEIPTAAYFKALQSLAPSPTIATNVPSSCSNSMRRALSSGDMLA